jgi:hypothetical protein
MSGSFLLRRVTQYSLEYCVSFIGAVLGAQPKSGRGTMEAPQRMSLSEYDTKEAWVSNQ